MSDDFLSLKRNSKNSLQQYSDQAKKLETSFEKDARFWTASPDKAGNAKAIIRFLPPSKNQHVPFVKLFSHGFDVGSNWYIENCPTTLDGAPCPVCEHNSSLWDRAEKEQPGFDKHPLKEVVRKRKRKLSYISNIYVIRDDNNPENNGKVFLYKYGKSIFDIIKQAMHPTFKGEEPINPFDFWEGANFTLKQIKKDGYPNFESSSFSSETSALFDNDEAISSVWKQQHNLTELVASDKFKSYDDLQKRFSKVVKDEDATPAKAVAAKPKPKAKNEDDETPPFDTEDLPPKKAAAKTADDFFDELLSDD